MRCYRLLDKLALLFCHCYTQKKPALSDFNHKTVLFCIVKSLYLPLFDRFDVCDDRHCLAFLYL